MNIFEIKQELLNIFQQIEDNDGELTPELEAEFTNVEVSLKDKIESFVNYIKCLNNDNNLITAEIARLKTLQNSKSKTIEKLNKILVDIITQFGSEQKNGVKYYDYGTGKISLRKSTSVEVDDTLSKAVVKTAFSHLNWLRDIHQIDAVDGLNGESIIEGVKQGEQDDNGESIIPSMNVNPEELQAIKSKVSFTLPISDLINGYAFPALRSILKYTNNYKAEPVIDKTEIKKTLQENGSAFPNLAKLSNNLNVSIK